MIIEWSVIMFIQSRFNKNGSKYSKAQRNKYLTVSHLIMIQQVAVFHFLTNNAGYNSLIIYPKLNSLNAWN